MYEHKEMIGTVVYGLYWAVVAYAAYIGLVRRRRPAYQRVATRNRAASSSERGQGLVEYALIMVLVAVVVIGVLAVLGPSIKNIF